MAQITREITVDVAQLNRFEAIVAKQYDKSSRFLKVQLLNREEPIWIDPGATVTINARRKDNQSKVFAGEVNTDGTVTVPITYWMLELDDTVKCDISIIVGTDTVLKTTLFELFVQEAAADEQAITDDDDYDILLRLINEVKSTEQQLTSQYEASAAAIRQQYEASMAQAVEDCQTAVDAAQLVTGPFYIVDNDNHKTYTAAIQVRDGKPVMLYDEFTGG